MKAAVLEKPVPTAVFDVDRVRAIVLLRIASAEKGVAKAEIAADLAPLASHRLPAGHWRALIEREIAALADAGLVATQGRTHRSFRSRRRSRRHLPRSQGKSAALVARGARRAPHRQNYGARARGAKAAQSRWPTPDGLRAAILQRAYKLKIKGVPTASRLRSALAAIALERAFGNKVQTGLAGKLGLSAKAGRLLAGQLSQRPRDYGTDRRLVAALAAEHAGAAQPDDQALRLALIRGFIEESDEPAASKPKRKPAPPVLVRPIAVPVAPPADLTVRPDLAGFAQEVRLHAVSRAQGWPGDRKAYISHVWRHIRDTRPAWGLSEIEFKAMLAEAHRAGHIVLANADLKDNENARDLQELRPDLQERRVSFHPGRRLMPRHRTHRTG